MGARNFNFAPFLLIYKPQILYFFGNKFSDKKKIFLRQAEI